MTPSFVPTRPALIALRPLAAVLRRSETRTPMGGRVITLGRPMPLWLLALAAVTLAPLLLVGAAALA